MGHNVFEYVYPFDVKKIKIKKRSHIKVNVASLLWSVIEFAVKLHFIMVINVLFECSSTMQQYKRIKILYISHGYNVMSDFTQYWVQVFNKLKIMASKISRTWNQEDNISGDLFK